MVEMLEYVSLQETEMERIEKQQVDMTAEFMGMQSYSWQKQKKEDKENPIEEDWEDIIDTYDTDECTIGYEIIIYKMIKFFIIQSFPI